MPVADELEHLAELQQHVETTAFRQQRREALEVVDRRRVGVRGLRGVAGAAEVLALLVQILAVPVVMREEIEIAVDRVGFGLLDVIADALVQHRPEARTACSRRRPPA